jgi:adenylate kinase
MLPNVFVVGVNGVGKTEILRRVAALRPDLTIVPGSAALMEYLGRPGDYEYLRAYPQDQALKALNTLLNDLIDQRKDGGLIFDAHLLNLVRGREKDVTPEIVHTFNAIVMIRGEVDSIYGRMAANGRDRALFRKGLSPQDERHELCQYQLRYVEKFFAVVGDHNSKSRVPLSHRIIPNYGDLDAAVEKFLKFYDSIVMENAP